MLFEVLHPELWLAATGLAMAGLVKGVTGIGYATCAMPLLAMAVGLEKALALVIVPAIVSNAAVFLGGGDLVRTFVRFRLLYAGLLPGIACGTAVLGLVDPALATQGLALLTLTYVVIAVAKPQLHLPPGLERPLALPAGILNGVLTGLTGSQILPLVPYMLALRLDANTQVIAINLAVTIASLALGVALLAAGHMTSELMALSCAGALPAIAGTLTGNVLRERLPVAGLRRLTLAMLVVVSIGLGGRAALDAALRAWCEEATAVGSTSGSASHCLAQLNAAILSATYAPAEPPPSAGP